MTNMERAIERELCETCGQALPVGTEDWVLSLSGREYQTEIEAQAAAIRLNRSARNFEYRPAVDAAGHIRVASRRVTGGE